MNGGQCPAPHVQSLDQQHEHHLGDAGLVPHFLGDWHVTRANVKSTGLPDCPRPKQPSDWPGRSCLCPDLFTSPTPTARPTKKHPPLTCLGQKTRYSLAMQTRKVGSSRSKYSELMGRACMPEKCSSAASFSSVVASCSPLCFLDARRAWRKTSTCRSRPGSWRQCPLGRAGRPRSSGSQGATGGGKREGVWRGRDPRATSAPTEL